MRSTGEQDIASANEANIPVNIFLRPVEDDDSDEHEEGETHVLRADNFMPRKCSAYDGAYEIFGTLHELRALVSKHVVPLYYVALQNVSQIAEGTGDTHYYWENDHEQQPAANR